MSWWNPLKLLDGHYKRKFEKLREEEKQKQLLEQQRKHEAAVTTWQAVSNLHKRNLETERLLSAPLTPEEVAKKQARIDKYRANHLPATPAENGKHYRATPPELLTQSGREIAKERMRAAFSGPIIADCRKALVALQGALKREKLTKDAFLVESWIDHVSRIESTHSMKLGTDPLIVQRMAMDDGKPEGENYVAMGFGKLVMEEPVDAMISRFIDPERAKAAGLPARAQKKIQRVSDAQKA